MLRTISGWTEEKPSEKTTKPTKPPSKEAKEEEKPKITNPINLDITTEEIPMISNAIKDELFSHSKRIRAKRGKELMSEKDIKDGKIKKCWLLAKGFTKDGKQKIEVERVFNKTHKHCGLDIYEFVKYIKDGENGEEEEYIYAEKHTSKYEKIELKDVKTKSAKKKEDKDQKKKEADIVKKARHGTNFKKNTFANQKSFVNQKSLLGYSAILNQSSIDF